LSSVDFPTPDGPVTIDSFPANLLRSSSIPMFARALV
jgi:hypothetical protein